MHTYFNPTIPIEGGRLPIIEPRTSSPVYTAGVTSVPIEFGVRSTDKLHQAILFARTPAIDNSLSVKACRGLQNEKNTVVTFDYDGGIPSKMGSNLNSFEIQNLSISVTNAVGDEIAALFELINTKLRTPISRFSPAPIVFSPDGELLAVNGRGDSGGIKLWNVSTGELIPGPIDSYERATFSPDSKLLAFHNDGSIKIWDRLNRRYVATFFHDSSDFIFSPDGVVA